MESQLGYSWYPASCTFTQYWQQHWRFPFRIFCPGIQVNSKLMKGNSSPFTGLVASCDNSSKRVMKRATRAIRSQGSLSETFIDVYVTNPSSLLPKHQRRGCHIRYSENVPSWCWRGHPEYLGETGQNNEGCVKKEYNVDHRVWEHTSTMHHSQGVHVHMNQDSEHPACPPTEAQWVNKGWHFQK